MSFTIINELDYKTTGPRIVEKNKVVVFKNTQGNIIGENTENIKINNGIEISNENNTGSIILEPSSSSTISQTLTFPATEGNSGQILENVGSGQLSWVNKGGGGGSGDVEGPDGSTDTAIAIYDGITGNKIKNTGVKIDDTNSITNANEITAIQKIQGGRLTDGTAILESGELKFKGTAGTHYISLKASDSIDSNFSLTLPLADAITPGYVLGSDASGNLDWYNRAALWVNGKSYYQDDLVIAHYENEYRFFIALNDFTSASVEDTFPGEQNIYIPPSGTATGWQEISPFRGAMKGQVSFASTLSPDALTGDVDNYYPEGLGRTNFLRLETNGGNYTISGLQAPYPEKTNQGLFICNVGLSGNIQLLNNSNFSRDENKFLIGGTKTIQRDEGIMLIYDSINDKWRSQAIQI